MIDYEVVSHYADLGQKKDKQGNVVTVRLNKVRWGNGKPMWDLRAWSADDKPQKGFTLTDEMMKNLADVLASVDLGQ